MMDVLSRRQLGRATLARQMLLGRWEGSVVGAVERLAGLNAQDPEPSYIGLWTRLAAFEAEELTRALENREVVRSTTLRGTQHIHTAGDYLSWRPVLQLMLDRIRRGALGRATRGIDPEELAEAGRELLAEAVLTRPELGRRLAERWPDHDPGGLARSVQYLVPIVHPPPSGTWGHHGPTPFVLTESWLGRPVEPDRGPEALIRRYLAAFGPASVMDIQAWSGLTKLREPVERLAAELRLCRDEQGRQLYDLPDAPRPDPDVPAPPRFLPAVDNLLLAHTDRTRVMTDEQRRRVCIGAVVEPTVLLDGQVCAIWRITRERSRARLVIESFGALPVSAGDGIVEEGLRLLAFAAGDTEDHDVHFAQLS